MTCRCGAPGRPSSPRECSPCESKRKAAAYQRRKEAGVTAAEATCGRCGETKPSSEFRNDWHHANGLYGLCHACESARRRTKSFDISQEQYDYLYGEQMGVCALCGQPETHRVGHGKDRVRRLAIDHDHETGMIRGLLCGNCNKGLGNLGDNVDRLLNAVRYLVAHGKPLPEGVHLP